MREAGPGRDAPLAVRAVRGLRLTELGLGAAQLGNLYRNTSDAEAEATIDAAWEAGIRVFDTAPHYGLGLSERRLGAGLRERPRDHYVLSTKVGRLLEPSPERAHLQDDEGFVVPAAARRVRDYSRDGVLRSIEDSLARLGTDRIDIVYLHDPDEPEMFAQASSEGIGALIELREQGVVRAVGAGMNAAEPLAELIRRADVDLVMCAGRHSLLDHAATDELLPLAHDRGVGIVAAGVYNSGLLSRPRPDADARYDYLPAPQELLARTNRIADLCEEHGVTLPDAATQFPLANPAVVCAVVGVRGVDQVASLLTRYRTPIPDALWAALADAGLIPPSSPAKGSR
ncbi:aldo/keto reductase [Demequina maris]|uniref:aldo/keto reductase n=1 Tax=Demequina maris TaxID=1638982 RepID=UPI000780E744|nr:aldo/keto reductase [Demequina maris]